MPHGADHLGQLLRNYRVPAHQAHRVGPGGRLRHAADLINHHVGAANHREHLRRSVTQGGLNHTIIRPLTFAAAQKAHAHSTQQQANNTRYENNQGGSPSFLTSPLSDVRRCGPAKT